MIARTLTLCVTILVLSHSALTLAQAVTTLTEQERDVVQKIIDDELICRSFHTLYTESVWETEIDGEVEFSHCVLKQDDLGRTHYVEQAGSGQWSPDAAAVATEWICNGEITVRVQPMNLDEETAELLGREVLAANVDHGTTKVRIRDVLATGSIARKLEKALLANAITSVVDDASESRIEIKWRTDSPQIQYEAVFDTGFGYACLIEKSERRADGTLVSQERTTFLPDGRGLPIPHSNYYMREIRNLSEDQILQLIEASGSASQADAVALDDLPPPTTMTRTMKLLEVRIDDPNDFQESEFAVALPLGTYVWDKRFKVGYMLEDDADIDSNLSRLAAMAREKAADGNWDPMAPLQAEIANKRAARRASTLADFADEHSRRRAILIWVNLALLTIALIAFSVWRMKYRT